MPPVYVWVGCANMIGQRKRSRRSIAASFRQQQCDASLDGLNYFSRVTLTQSAMESGHYWHMFAAKERLNPPVFSSEPSMSRALSPKQAERDLSYHYIGSSSASRGRPSSHIMN